MFCVNLLNIFINWTYINLTFSPKRCNESHNTFRLENTSRMFPPIFQPSRSIIMYTVLLVIFITSTHDDIINYLRIHPCTDVRDNRIIFTAEGETR